ncbi:MAG: hypothetical protein NG737_04780 [Omnitrophica bacterium]|nr:hypothetical protein [Candidatus Omnitrophota bacterium]
MKELIVRIKHDNTTAEFSSRDVQYALVHLFGINTNFEVEQIESENSHQPLLVTEKITRK